MFKKGDKPGKGKYKCKECGFNVEMPTENDEIPICEGCYNPDAEFEKVPEDKDFDNL